MIGARYSVDVRDLAVLDKGHPRTPGGLVRSQIHLLVDQAAMAGADATSVKAARALRQALFCLAGGTLDGVEKRAAVLPAGLREGQVRSTGT